MRGDKLLSTTRCGQVVVAGVHDCSLTSQDSSLSVICSERGAGLGSGYTVSLSNTQVTRAAPDTAQC